MILAAKSSISSKVPLTPISPLGVMIRNWVDLRVPSLRPIMIGIVKSVQFLADRVAVMRKLEDTLNSFKDFASY